MKSKLKLKLKHCIPSALLGLVLAGSVSLSQAAPTIVVNAFNSSSETNTWTELTGNGVLEWINTDNAGESTTPGCLKVTLPYSTGGNQVQPQVTLGANAFNSAQYWSVSFDLKVDPSSGFTVNDLTTFGHWQVVARNASQNWVGLNWTVLDSSYTNGWRHVEVSFGQPYDNVSYLVFQVQGGPFLSDFTFYLDNIQINPIPLEFVIEQFTNASSASLWSWGNWAKPGLTNWVSSPDAGGATPPGSLQISNLFDNLPGSYQQVVFQRGISMDATRFTYLDMDVQLDPSSYPAADGSGSYGDLNVFMQIPSGSWPWIQLGSHTLRAADMNQWTLLRFPLGGLGLTNVGNLVLQLGRGWSPNHGLTNTVVYYIDNIKVWSPQVPPTLSLTPSGPAGLQLICNGSYEWERQNIVTPSLTRNYSWVPLFPPVTYSFTLTNFPDAKKYPGFEAHVYLVNYDTLPGTGDETAAAVDWNAADLINVKVVNAAAGGVDFSFNFKTNLPGANVNNQVVSIHEASALGTWSVTFNSATTGVLTTPSGATAPFTIEQAVADRFNAQMSLDFGVFKGGVANMGASATFSHISVTGVPNPINESFPGPGLNPDPTNPAWRLALDPLGLVWIPQGTAYWLNWSMPDTGFLLQTSSSLSGTWTDPGLTYIVEGGSSKQAAVPAASLPSPSIGFFRMAKPAP